MGEVLHQRFKVGRKNATGNYDTRGELEKHVKLFFLLFPDAHQMQCADLTGVSVATINRIVNQ